MADDKPRFKQNSPIATDRYLYFVTIDSSDGKTLLSSTDLGTITWTKNLSKNGAAGVAATGAPVEVDSTNLKGLWYLPLAKAEIDTVGALNAWIQATGTLKISTLVPISAEVAEAYFTTAATGTLSATQFTSDRTEATGYWNNALVHARTGALAGQVQKVSTFVTTGGLFTVANAFSAAPAIGDVFEILTR